jgi:hypothetical protein
MSGGHFDTSPYQLSYLIDDIRAELRKPYYQNEGEEIVYYSPEVVKVMKETVQTLDKLFHTVKALDYYLAGDIGDESFVSRMKELEG